MPASRPDVAARSRKRSSHSYDDYADALADALASCPRVLWVQGAEEYLRRDALARVEAALRRTYPDLERLALHGPDPAGGEGTLLRDLVAECGTSSLFASRRVILLRRGDRTLFPTGGADERAQEAFCALLDAPGEDLWLLLETEGSFGQFALGKRLAKSAHVVPCPEIRRPQEAEAFLRETARRKEKDLDREAASLLVQAHGTHLGTLASEVEKLVAHAGDAPAISAADVEQFLTGSFEFDVFGLTNAVEARDLSQALLYAGRILRIGTRDTQGRHTDAAGSAHRALSMLASTLENLLVARIALAEGADDATIAGRLRTSPFRARHLARAAREHSVSDLRRSLDAVAHEIHATHDTGGDPELSLLRASLAAARPGA